MLCLVCGKDLGDKDLGTMCPVCGFPIFEILGDNREEEIRKMKPEIDSHRNEFCGNVTVSVITYHWSADNGQMKKDSEKELPFGTLRDLYNKSSWLSESFDSPSDRKTVDVTIRIKSPAGSSEHKVQVPNARSDKSVKLGIKVYEDMKFSLLVKGGDLASEKSSEKRPLF